MSIASFPEALDHLTIMDGDSGRFIAEYISDQVSQDLQKNAVDNRVAEKEQPVDA